MLIPNLLSVQENVEKLYFSETDSDYNMEDVVLLIFLEKTNGESTMLMELEILRRL